MIHTNHFWEQEWKEKEWTAWQNRLSNSGVGDILGSLGEKERDDAETNELSFRETIERRAQVLSCLLWCY